MSEYRISFFKPERMPTWKALLYCLTDTPAPVVRHEDIWGIKEQAQRYARTLSEAGYGPVTVMDMYRRQWVDF